MIREDRFVLSRRPYALKLDGLARQVYHPPGGGPGYCRVTMQAVWFKGPRTSVSACIGYLWCFLDSKPASLEEAAQQHTDGRYGGHCQARLRAKDGYWAAEGGSTPDQIQEHLRILEPMLAAAGEIADGYSGWWRF